jgi:hypothetical protein
MYMNIFLPTIPFTSFNIKLFKRLNLMYVKKRLELKYFSLMKT